MKFEKISETSQLEAGKLLASVLEGKILWQDAESQMDTAKKIATTIRAAFETLHSSEVISQQESAGSDSGVGV